MAHNILISNPIKMFLYLTTWNFILVTLYFIFNKYIDLVFSSLVILLISSYFVYIRPRYFEVEKINGQMSRYEGMTLQIAHFLFHIVPFAFVVYVSNYVVDYRKLFFTVALMYTYFIVIDVEELYKISRQEMMLIALAVLLFIIGLN